MSPLPNPADYVEKPTVHTDWFINAHISAFLLADKTSLHIHRLQSDEKLANSVQPEVHVHIRQIVRLLMEYMQPEDEYGNAKENTDFPSDIAGHLVPYYLRGVSFADVTWHVLAELSKIPIGQFPDRFRENTQAAFAATIPITYPSSSFIQLVNPDYDPFNAGYADHQAIHEFRPRGNEPAMTFHLANRLGRLLTSDWLSVGTDPELLRERYANISAWFDGYAAWRKDASIDRAEETGPGIARRLIWLRKLLLNNSQLMHAAQPGAWRSVAGLFNVPGLIDLPANHEARIVAGVSYCQQVGIHLPEWSHAELRTLASRYALADVICSFQSTERTTQRASEYAWLADLDRVIDSPDVSNLRLVDRLFELAGAPAFLQKLEPSARATFLRYVINRAANHAKGIRPHQVDVSVMRNSRDTQQLAQLVASNKDLAIVGFSYDFKKATLAVAVSNDPAVLEDDKSIQLSQGPVRRRRLRVAIEWGYRAERPSFTRWPPHLGRSPRLRHMRTPRR